MQELFLNPDNFKYINLYSSYPIIDEFVQLKLCKTVIDNNLGAITVPDSQVENVWKWLDLSNKQLNAVINNFDGKLSVGDVFRKIKSVFNCGANLVEVILPPFFFDIDIENIPSCVDEYLSAINEAKGIRNVKVSLESSFIKNSYDLKGIVYLLSKYKIDFVKTASGLYTSSSTLPHLNAILEEAKSANVKVDFLFDENLSDTFVIDDAVRLAQSIFGEENLKQDDFYISCDIDKFLKSLGKSTC